MENCEIFEIGADLSKAAREMPMQPRGLVEDLFPFIYEASRRISTRAISRWLESEHGVKLSAVTIAKALRNSERHWEEFGGDIQVAARVIEDLSDCRMEDFLFDTNLLGCLLNTDFIARRAGNPDEHAELANDWHHAEKVLVKRWVPLSPLTQSLAAPYVLTNRSEEPEGEVAKAETAEEVEA